MKIGLALGGGGAKGLAHIPLLETIDEMGITPHRITGTSIGAIMGGLYASGMPGAGIREMINRLVISRDDSFRDALKKDFWKWVEFMDIEFGKAALFKGEKILGFLCDQMGVSTFEELKIPFAAVATDFWTSEQVVMDSGELLTAVKASMGLPGVFTPVERGGRVLIDGGGVNPVPHDIIDDCDIVVAIDVMGTMGREGNDVPNLVRAVVGTFDIMQKSIVAQKLKLSPPEVYVKPEIRGIDILDFHKADEVYRQSGPASKQLRESLEEAINKVS